MWIGTPHSFLTFEIIKFLCFLDSGVGNKYIQNEPWIFCLLWRNHCLYWLKMGLTTCSKRKWNPFHISSKQCWNPSLLIITFSLKIIKIPITFFPLFNFSVMFFTHLLHNVTHFPQHVTNVLLCFTWLLWKYLISAFPAVYWGKKNLKKKKEKGFFFFTCFFFTLSDSISRSIGISEATRHEISPILGFQRKSIFENSRDMWSYYFLLLWTDCSIMWQLWSWLHVSLVDKVVPEQMIVKTNWKKCVCWRVSVNRLTVEILMNSLMN